MEWRTLRLIVALFASMLYAGLAFGQATCIGDRCGNPPIPAGPNNINMSQWLQGRNFAIYPLTPVTLATVGPLSNTPVYNNTLGTLTGSTNGALSIDGTAVGLSQRVLVNNQANAVQNGIYIVNTPGDSGHAFVLLRSSDMATTADFIVGKSVYVTGGSTNVSASFLLSTYVITLGASNISFAQYTSASAAGQFSGSTAHVATNAILANSSTASYPNGVWRDDFRANAGAGPVFYLPSTNACTVNAGAGDDGYQVASVNGKCWLGQLNNILATPLIWGAVCDGTTDDVGPLQQWLNAGAAGVSLTGAYNACAFKSALALTNPNGLRILGSGPYQAVLKYTGASGIIDLLTIGSTAGSATNNIYIQGLRIYSTTTMTAGTALTLANVSESTFRDIILDGLAGTGLLWNGLWCNQCADIKWFGGDMLAQGDALRVNGTVGAGNKAEFLTVGTRIRGTGASSVGIHIAGGFGGFSCTGYTSIDVAHTNILIDQAVTAEGNREIFINPDCIVDTAQQDNIQVNDAGPGGNITLLGWNASAGRYGVNIIQWTGGWVTINNGPTLNAASDNIHLSDNSASYIIGVGRNSGGGGWGVNCTVAIAQVYAQPGTIMSGNSSGDYAPNCSPKTLVPGASTFTGTATFNGPIVGTSTSGLTLSQPATFQITPEGTVLTLKSGATNTDDQGAQMLMTNTGVGVTAPNKYARVSRIGSLEWLNSAYGAVVMSMTDAGGLKVASFMQLATTVVGSLPTCNAGAKSQVYAVTNANGPTYGAVLAAGGAAYALAVCDGTNWTAH